MNVLSIVSLLVGLAGRIPIAVAVLYFGLAPPLWAAEPDTGSVPAVTVVKAKRACFLNTLEVTGLVVPRHEIQVRPPSEGLQISQVLVQPGDAVISGQVLARLKSPDGSKGSASDTAVTAPEAGIVYFVSAVVGEAATAAGPPLFRIAQKGEMELAVETPVSTMHGLAVNQTAKVEIIGITDEMSGKVDFISKAINQTTQLGPVRLVLNADQRVRVGAFGRGKIEIEQRCGPAIPLSAVLYAEGGAVVQVVRDGQVETRRVTVGNIKGNEVEIRDGLAEGETVAARAGAFLRDGDRVQAMTASRLLDAQ